MAKKPTNIFGKKGGFPVNPQSSSLPGQQPVNINIGPDDITYKSCEQCSGEFFDLTYRKGIISGVNPKNVTGKDQVVQVPVVVCRACGVEFRVKVEAKE